MKIRMKICRPLLRKMILSVGLLFLVHFIPAQTGPHSLVVDVSNPGTPVAPICQGQQIEEFNYQFEGGLYAQLINNPSFEELKDPLAAWSLIKNGKSAGNVYSQNITQTALLNTAQKRCVKLSVASVVSGPVGIANSGYWGIAVRNKVPYIVSFWAKIGSGTSGLIQARLEGNDGKVYAQSEKLTLTASWKHFICTLVADGVPAVTGKNRFVLYSLTKGDVYFDVVTLMPPTWKNRPNGLRVGLAEKLAALKPRFIQFPGGCTAESSSMDVSWNWKNSVGPLEKRAGSTRHRWNYRNDLYFGLDEYLQLCEDLGADAVYTTSAGISEGKDNREWFSISPLNKMQPIILDILDLIEYCNGPASTVWGAKRIANGHPKPYHLKYLEIGNENNANWAKTQLEYRVRYKLIHDAIAARYRDIKFMYNGENGTSVPSDPLGNVANFVDEHFYMKDVSVMYNKYDSINPASGKICVAEYASSIKGNGGNVIGNFGDALGDAAFMLGCEKNSERLWWTGYGNYSGLLEHGNFGPCLVWNDAVSCFATPSYYMEKMLFADNHGSLVLPFWANTPGCYWSATLDTMGNKHDLLLKVVNKAATSSSVNITIRGVAQVDTAGEMSMLTEQPDVENSISAPEKILPKSGSFVASPDFAFELPALTICVLRIHL